MIIIKIMIMIVMMMMMMMMIITIKNSLLTYFKQIAIYKLKVDYKETIFKHNRIIFKHIFFKDKTNVIKLQ